MAGKHRRALRKHRCEGCGAEIPKGSGYLSERFQSLRRTYRWHTGCWDRLRTSWSVPRPQASWGGDNSTWCPPSWAYDDL